MTQPVGYRACGYRELAGNALDVVPVREQPENLLFAVCEATQLLTNQISLL